ncbi:MAG TPA: CPBP family intramembrane metalloprotease [Dermatophilaceae bacterium]|nr:CPBP family intramembrane metalloprotease [Dermatophilaceae bacterium]
MSHADAGMPRPRTALPGARSGLLTEVLIVLGLSLGASAIWSVLRIVERLTRAVPLGQQTSSLNTSVTPDRPWLDLAYQLTGIGLALVPVALCLYLLARVEPPEPGTAAYRVLGLDLRRPRLDLGGGVVLAAAIGIPGLGLYLVATRLGFNTQVAPANLAGAWWTVPVLVLSALQNAVLEEVIVVGYLLTRLEQMGVGARWAVGISAVVRGSYHLYQGFGGFVGNIVMGVVFALVWRRWRRVGPLVVAHALIDIVAFVGYALLKDHLPWG